MKKPVKIVLGIIAGVFLVTLIALILTLVGFDAPEFRIFADMDELSFLDEYCELERDDDGTVLEGLNVIERKCMNVDYNGSRFQVYAYVFQDEADAQICYDRVKTATKDHNGWYYRIYQSNRAFFAFGPSKGSRAFNTLLYEHFSSTVDHLD